MFYCLTASWPQVQQLAKNVFPEGTYTNTHTQYLYTAGHTDQQLQTCSVLTQTASKILSCFPLLLVRMKICVYIPMCMMWIPPAAGLRHSSRVSQVSGICVYELPKPQPHSVFWYRPTHRYPLPPHTHTINPPSACPCLHIIESLIAESLSTLFVWKPHFKFLQQVDVN